MGKNSISGKVVWIIGASSGIGRATAIAFSNEGASVIVSARNEGELQQLSSELASDHLVLPLDMTDADARLRAWDAARTWKGHVDILVANAGISQRALALETTEETLRRVMEVNFFSTVALTKLVAPSMIDRKSGQIVVATSVTGQVATPLRSGYAASKHALHGYFDALRAELHDTGVGVTLIMPGFVSTNISRAAVTADGSPLGRLEDNTADGISAEECAAGIVKATAAQKREKLIGGKEIFAVYLKRFAPGVVARIIPRAVPK